MDERKVVAVTGGARGLGRAFCGHFARDGYRVAVCDIRVDDARDVADAIEQTGGTAIPVRLDVTDETSANAMADELAGTWGRVDILINNAGLWGDIKMEPVMDVSVDYWDTIMAVNLRGPLLCSRAVAPSMRERHWGRIVNISSMGAYLLGKTYSISKLAVHHLTWSLADELGASGITVNCVAPGTMDTEATRRQDSDEHLERVIAANIVKRLGRPEDIYAALRYFTSDEAEWCTGQSLLVNGGFNVRL